MKKLIAIITALLFALAPIGASAVTVSVPPSLGVQDGKLWVALRLEDNIFVSAAAIQIEYDSDKLSYLSYQKGEKLTAEYCHVAVIEEGKLQLSFTDGSRNFTGDGVLVYLCFKVAGNATGIVRISPLVTEGALFDRNYIELEYNVTSGTAYILSSALKDDAEIKGEYFYLNRRFAAVELSQRLGQDVSLKQNFGFVGSGCTVNYNGNKFFTVYMGDVNGDALVNTTDYLSVRAYLCGATPLNGAYAKAADINGDGVNSTADLLSFRRLLSDA